MTHQLYVFCIVALSATFFGCSDGDQLPTLSTVIQCSVDAIGGEAALQAVESVWRQRNERTFTLRKRPNLHLVLLRLSDGFERAYYLNAATYRIERARDVRRFHAYEEEVQPIEGVWSDFREIHGVWVPFTTGERNFETGKQLSGGTMRQIRFNVSIPDEVFAPDGSIEPFLRLIRELVPEG